MDNNQSGAKRAMSPKEFWLKVVLIGALVVACVVTFAPVVMQSSRPAHGTGAMSNARQVYLLLIEFDYDFGSFPNDETADADQDLKGYTGEYSNDYLGQLIAGGYTQSEEIFYAKGGSGIKKKPDNNIATRADILSEGECGFAYIKGLSLKHDLKTPVLLAPMYGDGYKFNPHSFNEKAVVLRIDGAVQRYRLTKEMEADIGGGKTLFEDGPDSVWAQEGVDRVNLLYAKSPYTPPHYSFRRDLTPIDVFLFLLLIYVLFLIVRMIVRRSRAKACSRNTEQNEKRGKELAE